MGYFVTSAVARTYELLLLRGKALGRRFLALPEEETKTAALADFGRARMERAKAPEPLVEAAAPGARRRRPLWGTLGPSHGVSDPCIRGHFTGFLVTVQEWGVFHSCASLKQGNSWSMGVNNG